MRSMVRIAALLLGAVLLPAAAGAPHALVPDRSEIAFSVKQMGVPVSGRFTRFDARVELDPANPQTATVQIDVDITSLATGNDEADALARDRPWLDAAGFPRATFTSSAVRALGGERWAVDGTLTIRGRPRQLTVPFTLQPQAGGALLASGEFAIRRTDFGVGGGEWNEGELVADEVPVRFRLWLAPPAP